MVFMLISNYSFFRLKEYRRDRGGIAEAMEIFFAPSAMPATGGSAYFVILPQSGSGIKIIFQTKKKPLRLFSFCFEIIMFS
jgi:hypothetical protein